MNLNSFSTSQRQALLDLAILGMYADGHLASDEDERVQRLLALLGMTTPFDRSQAFDAAITRVRQHTPTAESRRALIAQLAGAFTLPEQRRQVAEFLNDLLTSDSQLAAIETQFLATAREAMGL